MIDRTLNYGRHHVLNFLQQAMPFERVLDLGAGGGDDLALARAVNAGAKLHAIEPSRPAAARLAAQGMAVYACDLERTRLPFDDQQMDVVIANQILEHTKEVFWIAHEISRVLRVGGKLIIGVPNLASLHNRLLLACGRQPTPIRTCSAHVRGFTKQDILEFLERGFPAGYVLRAWGGSNFYPFPPVLARPLAWLFPTLAWGIFLLLEKRVPYAGGFLEVPVRDRLETNFFLGEAS